MHISGIKTKEDALLAIDSAEIPCVHESHDAAQVAHVESQALLVKQVKEFAKGRIAALPESVKIVGIEVRATTGDIELISIRIISHK